MCYRNSALNISFLLYPHDLMNGGLANEELNEEAHKSQSKLQRTKTAILLQHCKVLRQYYKVLRQYYSALVPLQHYSVLQSTTPARLCTAKYYSSTSLFYKVLLQFFSVLQSSNPVQQSTAPVLLILVCTAQRNTPVPPSTTQRTTPVLPCTTKYYSSTTVYCKVLLQYYSVLICLLVSCVRSRAGRPSVSYTKVTGHNLNEHRKEIPKQISGNNKFRSKGTGNEKDVSAVT